MPVKIFFHEKAAKEIKKLDKKSIERIKKEIKKLENNPKTGKHLKYCDFWSLRIGNYRVIYEVAENKIIVLYLGHRKNVYSDFSKLF